MPNELKIGRVYRHFKGDFYLVEAVANDSETGEPFVVYRKLYGDGGLWLRIPRIKSVRSASVIGFSSRVSVAIFRLLTGVFT